MEALNKRISEYHYELEQKYSLLANKMVFSENTRYCLLAEIKNYFILSNNFQNYEKVYNLIGFKFSEIQNEINFSIYAHNEKVLKHIIETIGINISSYCFTFIIYKRFYNMYYIVSAIVGNIKDQKECELLEIYIKNDKSIPDNAKRFASNILDYCAKIKKQTS